MGANKYKIINVVGVQPNFVKAAPIRHKIYLFVVIIMRFYLWKK